MAENTDDPEIDALAALPPEELSEELAQDIAKRWDPERLMQLVAARAGKGEQLDQTLRDRYEKRLGVDLGHVRVYTGTFAEEFNKSRSAEALTIGGTGMIMMGNTPERSMATTSGESLLAHELTHVAQATRGIHRKGIGNMEYAEEHEAEAEEVEQSVEQGAHHDNASKELRKNEGEKNQKEELDKGIREKVLAMLGDALRTLKERSGPRMRRP